MDFETWPAPSQPGQFLYVDQQLEPAIVALLQEKGWIVVDVRTLPNGTDADRAAALRCWLEGLRCGTIETNAARYKFIELEARTLGVLNTKTASDNKTSKQELDPLEALNFRSSRAFAGTQFDDIRPGPITKTTSKGGRPKGALLRSVPKTPPGSDV